MPSSETDSSTLNEDSSNTTPTNRITTNKDPANTSSPATNQDTNAQASLLRLTRRHSLPASYHLSNFLSFFSQNPADDTHDGPNVNEAQSTSKAPSQANTNTTRHTRSATASNLAGHTSTGSSVNRHRYGHRHTRSAVLDQPVVVRTYNPPATPRVPTRAGMMNPAIFEEEETRRVELPPIEAFSFDGILKAISPEVTKTLDKISFLCVRLKEDVKAEIEVTAQTQREIHSQKQQAEKLAAQALKTTNARTESLKAESQGFKGGAVIEDLAQLTERTYTTLGSIVSTLLAIDELLPPQERLAPEYSPHQTHYPRVHELLNKRYQEITARFGGSAIALGKGVETRTIPKITRQNTTPPTSSPPGSLDLLSASLPNPTHQEPGWLRRRMSSSSAMLLSSNSPTSDNGTSEAAKRLSLPPHLQLKIILPTPSHGQSPLHKSNLGLRRDPSPGLGPAGIALRRHTNSNTASRDRGDKRFTSRPNSVRGDENNSERSTRRSGSSNSGGIYGSGSWKGTGQWNIFGNGGAESTENERGASAEERLRQVLIGSNGKGKAVDRRA